ncbi:hypothetical protein [uncultured Cetobacterium sp.]|uniref:hypothetical protein n=1 Tax=uncultured Cetobacterium sp. TaxID=527638 RepID=UPI00260B221A|nr:hypothetical protein [uncultured Cetobacterium sp.]
MKYITEEYLREIYKRESFTTFYVEKTDKITLNGKEFLKSKNIEIKENESMNKPIKIKKDTYISQDIFNLSKELADISKSIQEDNSKSIEKLKYILSELELVKNSMEEELLIKNIDIVIKKLTNIITRLVGG